MALARCAIRSFHLGTRWPITRSTFSFARCCISADTTGARAALRINLNDSWTITPVLMAQETKAGGSNSFNPDVGDLQVQRPAGRRIGRLENEQLQAGVGHVPPGVAPTLVDEDHRLAVTDAAEHEGEHRQQAHQGPLVAGDQVHLLRIRSFSLGRVA